MQRLILELANLQMSLSLSMAASDGPANVRIIKEIIRILETQEQRIAAFEGEAKACMPAV